MADSISQVPDSSQQDVSLKIRETDKLPLRQEDCGESEAALVPLAREERLLFCGFSSLSLEYSLLSVEEACWLLTSVYENHAYSFGVFNGFGILPVFQELCEAMVVEGEREREGLKSRG